MGSALTLRPEHHPVLAERLARNPAPLVVALCAAWCETCRAFRPVFDRLAAAQSDALFLWLDIDDDSAVAGEIEIEGFPSLAVFRSGLPVFFGVAEPHERQLMRVLAAMAEGVLRPLPVPEAVATLPRALVRATAAPDGG